MAKRRASKSPSKKDSEDAHRKRGKLEEDEFSDDDSPSVGLDEALEETQKAVASVNKIKEDHDSESDPEKKGKLFGKLKKATKAVEEAFDKMEKCIDGEEEAPSAEKATEDKSNSGKSGEDGDSTSVSVKVEVMNFSSPLKGKKSSNPYYIHFMLVKQTLVAFYFSRARYGTNKTYANHLMMTLAGKNPPPVWVTELNVSSDEFHLHVNGVIQPHYNGSKYHKRLFMLDGAYKFKDRQAFVTFAREKAVAIEANLNLNLGSDSKVSVPEKDEDLVELKHDAVFADVAGRNAAGDKLVSILGEEYDPNDFEDYRDLCYAFFKPGTFPSHIGRIVGCSEADIEEPAIYN